MDLLVHTEEYVRKTIKKCQRKNHIHQVAFSTYHDGITHVCFGCGVVRTSINLNKKD